MSRPASPNRPPSAPPLRPSRDAAFDVFKGWAILAVILHHVSGAGIRETIPGSNSYIALIFVNRLLLFCVPAFLFLTLFLHTRSLLKRPVTPAEFWRKRYPRILVPYLIWCVFYVYYNAWTEVYKWEDLEKSELWWKWLAYGKANYHLYFLVIVLQIYLVLPGLVAGMRAEGPTLKRDGWMLAVLSLSSVLLLEGRSAFASPDLRVAMRTAGWAALFGAIFLLTRLAIAWGRRQLDRERTPGETADTVKQGKGRAKKRRREKPRRRFRFWAWLLLAFGLQLGVYWIHRAVIRSAYPASLLIWYLHLTVMGIWAARYYDEFQRRWPRLKWPLYLLTLAAFGAFYPAAMGFVEGREVDPFHYIGAYWAFTGLATLVLLGISNVWVERWPRVGHLLAFLGAYSMELYLIHPALLARLTELPFKGSTLDLALYLGATFVGVTAATLALGVLLRKIGLGGILFGR